MQNIKMVIAYDGTRFGGWQKQGQSNNTIQELLEKYLSEITGDNIDLIGSGRTDAGVHALGQVANFKTSANITPEELLLELTQKLPTNISVQSIEIVPERFHARYNANGKVYVYNIWNSPIPNPFNRNYSYWIPTPLDYKKIKTASEFFIGEHDFKSFSTGKTNKSTIRTIYSISVDKHDDEIKITYFGDGFLYNMVRIMTGTLIEIGQGTRQPKDILQLIENKDRSSVGFTAPPNGLFLAEVKY